MTDTFKIGSKTTFFHGELREARLNAGLSQRDLSNKLGMSVPTYNQIENLHQFPTLENLDKLCKFYGKTKEELFPEWAKVVFIDDRKAVIREIEVDHLALTTPEILRLTSPETPDEEFEKENVRELLSKTLETLNPRERKVLKLRFGLEDSEEMTLDKVATEFGVTKERIRQIEAKALRKLRHPSRSANLKDFIVQK